jgi:hypothetical protein
MGSEHGCEARQAHAGGVRAVKAQWLRRCGALRHLAPVEARWDITPATLLMAAREHTGAEPVAGAEARSSVSGADEGALLCEWPRSTGVWSKEAGRPYMTNRT